MYGFPHAFKESLSEPLFYLVFIVSPIALYLLSRGRIRIVRWIINGFRESPNVA
jgi:hypothetical protein